VANGPARQADSGAGSPSPADGKGRSAIGRLFGYLSLALKLALFGLVFALAVKNSDPVTLKFFLGHELATSLALALVVALCTGALAGVLAMTSYVIGLRRDGARARAEAAALRVERDALRLERDALGIERDALRAGREAAATASAGASMPVTERQVPHGL
jgi:putative membrane protein